jgi:hypothetical protein
MATPTETIKCAVCGTYMSAKATRCLVCGIEVATVAHLTNIWNDDSKKPRVVAKGKEISYAYNSEINRQTAPAIVAVLDFLLEKAVGYFGK